MEFSFNLLDCRFEAMGNCLPISKIFRSPDNRDSLKSPNWQLEILHFFFWIERTRPISVWEIAIFTWISSIFKILGIVQRLVRDLESFLFHGEWLFFTRNVGSQKFIAIETIAFFRGGGTSISMWTKRMS